MSPEKATVIGSLESVEVYANVLQEAKHNLTPLVRVDQCLGTAVTNPRIATHCMFIALGMPPEIIMIVEKEHLLISPILLLIKIGSG
jgi:hypothetical protein